MEILAVSLVAVLLVSLGYIMGVIFQRRTLKTEALADTLHALVDGLASIKLISANMIPQQPNCGERITIDYKISSELQSPVEVWLGLEIKQDIGDEEYEAITDSNEDRLIILDRGISYHKRYATIPSALPNGKYDFTATVLLGPVSDPQHSIVLDSIRLLESVLLN